jgi:3D (Asp-Asp-Asp) domain-containing protein
MRNGVLFWALAALLANFTPSLSDSWGRCLLPEGWVALVMDSGFNDILLNSAYALPPPQPAKPSQLRKGSYLGRFKVTFYWLVEEDAYSGEKSCPLYTTDGRVLGRFTPQFVRDFRTESCALLSDGRIISYIKRANCCQVVDVPVGANGFSLVELKSVAVDPAVIPVGSTIYIPEAEDAPLSNGTFHNGVFRAHDVGSAIKGDRIDVYLGLKSNMDSFHSTELCRSGEVDVYLLQ